MKSIFYLKCIYTMYKHILQDTYMYVCMYVCMYAFYVVHYHNNLMKAHHYHKSHQIPNDSLEKMNIIIIMFK